MTTHLLATGPTSTTATAGRAERRGGERYLQIGPRTKHALHRTPNDQDPRIAVLPAANGIDMLSELRQQRARDCVFGRWAVELEELYGAGVRGGDGGCCYQRVCPGGGEGCICAAVEEEAEGRGCVHCGDIG